MWPPISWLLLELLEKLELRAERAAAAKTLYEIVLKDGQLYEYFDSQTGRGLGFPVRGGQRVCFAPTSICEYGQLRTMAEHDYRNRSPTALWR